MAARGVEQAVSRSGHPEGQVTDLADAEGLGRCGGEHRARGAGDAQRGLARRGGGAGGEDPAGSSRGRRSRSGRGSSTVELAPGARLGAAPETANPTRVIARWVVTPVLERTAIVTGRRPPAASVTRWCARRVRLKWTIPPVAR